MSKIYIERLILPYTVDLSFVSFSPTHFFSSSELLPVFLQHNVFNKHMGVCAVPMCACVCVWHTYMGVYFHSYHSWYSTQTEWVLWCLHPERWEGRGVAGRINVSHVSHDTNTHRHTLFQATREWISELRSLFKGAAQWIMALKYHSITLK